jgi:DNA-binding HxlR family transcriptional regulator
MVQLRWALEVVGPERVVLVLNELLDADLRANYLPRLPPALQPAFASKALNYGPEGVVWT